MEQLKYIFVHGLSGWGSYDEQYERMPYWGMRNGDLMKQLRERGYDTYAASVAPHSSAYDRACELYAQLTGTVTDYGEAHSSRYGHPRYGRDFTGRPLIDSFDENTRLVLIGHSFGGATVRTFAHILAYGTGEAEENPFFRGGRADNIFAIVTLAAPHNGTTAYDMYEDPSFDVTQIRISLKEKIFSSMMSRANGSDDEILPAGDSAAYDMHIDNALALNDRLKMIETAYYFSQPCVITKKVDEDHHVPITKRTEILFTKSSRLMGIYQGKTKGGFTVDRSWLANDGLVNTVSATYPFGKPHRDYDPDDIPQGVWNVLEAYDGDHMSLEGGLTHKTEVLPYYLDLLKIIENLKK